MSEKIAVIRVRGATKANFRVKDTLKSLKLFRKNYCRIADNTPALLGMIKKIKDYVTYGEIDEQTYKQLLEKRGELYKGRETDKKKKIEYKGFIMVEKKKVKPFFRLNPPKKGFGRKGVKTGFNAGGALGYRGDKINDLIKRMI